MSVPFEAISTAFSWLPARMDTPQARVMLLAIGFQESNFVYRYQIVAGKPSAKGPARGFWQFEQNGGVAGVLRHPSSIWWARGLCDVRRVQAEKQAVWEALETDDVLAAGFARLLLWTDPAPLPPLGAKDAAWNTYLRIWRPGKPRPEKWADFYEKALYHVVGGAE